MAQWLPVALVACLLCGGEARLVGRSASSYQAAVDEVAAVEAEDRRFWTGVFEDLESELTRLHDAAAEAETAPATNSTNATSATSLHKNTTTLKKIATHHSNPLKGLKLNLNPKSVSDLVPALAMLKSLYEDGKERIAALNAREKKYKFQYAEKQARHNATLARIETRFKNHTLSAEFRANETRDENRLWSYWEKCRERQHRQYHTSLKIQHATMERVKNMMDMYEKTIAGTANKAQVVRQLARVSGGMPEIVFLQSAWRDMRGFCGQALEELHEVRKLGDTSVISLF